MNVRKLSKRILEGMLIGATLFGNLENVSAPAVDTGYTYGVHRQFLWDKAVREQNADGIGIPYISVPKSYCARYAVNLAKELFNKNYNGGPAWDLKYYNPVIYNFEKQEDTKNLIIEGKLQQGMLVSSKWPVKDINEYWTDENKKGLDKEGHPIKFTHVVEYIGIGRKTNEGVLDLPEPLFSHEWGWTKEVLTQKQLWDKYKIEFVNVINDKELRD